MMIKEIVPKMLLGYTKNDKVWLVRITLFVIFVSLFILFYGYNTTIEDLENNYNENMRKTIDERKVFKKFYEQGRAEHVSKFSGNLHNTNDMIDNQKNDAYTLWPLKIIIAEPKYINEFYRRNNRHEAQNIFKSWLEKISNPEIDINGNLSGSEDIDKGILTEQNPFLDKCMNDDGVWKDTNEKFRAMRSLKGHGTIILSQNAICRNVLNITSVSGHFISGNLEGNAQVTFKNKEQMITKFKRGVIDGILRIFRCEFGSCGAFEDPNLNAPTKLGEVSYYLNGVRQGLVWKFLMGGGFVVGNSESQKTITGLEIGYVYPDTLTAIVGQFENETLMDGRLYDVVDFDYGSKCPTPIFAPSSMSSLKKQDENNVYHYEAANQTYLGKMTLQRDPFEEKYLYVTTSTIPGAGRGVFLKRNVTKGEIVGFYNGVRLTGIESKVKHEDRRSPYRMDNEWAVPDQILNIPPNYRELYQYNATLGHLINHSNQPNAWFSMIDHPRFGKIRSIEMTKDASAGDELFCDYGFIEQYIQTENTVRNIYKIGKWWTNKSDEDYHKYLKEHIKYVRNKVHSVKPYLDMLRNWVQ